MRNKMKVQLKFYTRLFVITMGLLAYTHPLRASVAIETVAPDPNLNTTLVRIINQLDAILPLIDEAKKEQSNYAALPMQFEFDTFKTSDGKTHAGLRQDILSMRQALVNAVNQTPMVESHIKPLALDYRYTPNFSSDQKQ